MDILHLLRQRAAVEYDNSTWRINIDPSAPKQSRNRHTRQRGITYVRKTERYRTFAHKPVYCYVGTFKDLDVAVQARDAAEAINTRRLHLAVPETAQTAKNNARKIGAKLHRLNHKRIAAVFFADGNTTHSPAEGFPDIDSALDWLAACRNALPSTPDKKKAD